MNKHEKIREELAKIVGPEYVSDDEEVLYYYSYDPSLEPPRRPSFVVMPKSTEEVQKIVTLANREKIPITPRVGGMSLSGLAIPCEGGIVIDLKRMNRIIEVNRESMYAVVEAGVTTGQLKTYLEENFPDLEYPLPHAPPSVGVISNMVIWGGGHTSLKYGFSQDLINGLEVVLPTGEVVRVGSCAVTSSWITRAFLPELTGLFIGWFGATGIITKAGIQLWPKPEVRGVLTLAADKIEDVISLIMRIAKMGLADDIDVTSWTGSSRERYQMREKPPGVPEFYMDIFMSGMTKEEYDFKVNSVDKIVKDEKSKGSTIRYFEPPDIVKDVLLWLPQPLGFMDLREGGGVEYLGCCVPIERIKEAWNNGIEIAKKHDLQYLQLIRLFRGGHICLIMYTFPYNKKDPDEMKRVHDTLVEICEMVLNLGGLPWKPSPSLQKIVLKHADPAFLNLIKKIKALLDPNNIMNPHMWTP
ncbi:MAG: FAD-binding oxidoreductase [Candidatus Baldrarchaeia archaeon]